MKMATVDKVNKFARNVWLAGLGAYGRSTETVTGKLDKAYEESNQLFNDLVTRGSEIQATIDDKIKEKNVFERKVDEVREKLGLNQSVSEQQIDELTAKVDALTTVVTTLAQQRLDALQTPSSDEVKADATAVDDAEKPARARKAKAKTTEAKEA
ncbi:MAG: poly(hydroxyalkanoate) granule-associated protein [Alteromonadaceae bacterium]|jgi:poly(hydroxyalkanoate) granule-associated protein